MGDRINQKDIELMKVVAINKGCIINHCICSELIIMYVRKYLFHIYISNNYKIMYQAYTWLLVGYTQD